MSRPCIFSFDNAVIQDFAFPSPVIRYICINPIPSSAFILKIYYCCKYFYSNMKIIPVDGISHLVQGEQIDLKLEWNKKKIEYEENEFYKFDFKFFCNGITDIDCGRDPLIFSYLLNKKIWHLNSCQLFLINQCLTLKEYQMVADLAVSLSLYGVQIFAHNGKSVLAVDEILGMAQNLKSFTYWQNKKNLNVINTETVENLSKLKKSVKLRRFSLTYVPANFDAYLFSTFVKNNFEKHGLCSISFYGGIYAPTPAQFEAFKAIFFNEIWGDEEYKDLELYADVSTWLSTYS